MLLRAMMNQDDSLKLTDMKPRSSLLTPEDKMVQKLTDAQSDFNIFYILYWTDNVFKQHAFNFKINIVLVLFVFYSNARYTSKY